METTCQFSYPLNSANASPPGTFTVYLSWADRALPLNALTSAVTIAIVPMPLPFITSSSCVKLGGFDFFPDGAWYVEPGPYTNLPRRQLQARVTRRQCFHPFCRVATLLRRTMLRKTSE